MGYYPNGKHRYTNPYSSQFSRLSLEELDVLSLESVIYFLRPLDYVSSRIRNGFLPIKCSQSDSDGFAIAMGNGIVNQSTPANGINGNIAIKFDGASWLDVLNFSVPGSYSIFTVLHHTTTTVQRPIVGCQDALPTFTQAGQAHQFYVNSSNGISNRTGNTVVSSSTTLTNGVSSIVGVSHDDNQTSNNTRLYFGNSTTAATQGQINGTKKNFPNTSLFGGVGSSDWRWQTKVGPIIIVDKALHTITDDPDFTKILTYLNDYLNGTVGKYVSDADVRNNFAEATEGSGLLPAGGTDGQVLEKDGVNNFAARWADKPNNGVPSGGTNGQLLSVVSNSPAWVNTSTVKTSLGLDNAISSANASVLNVITITQAEYDALTPKVATTLYIITD